MLEQVPGPVLMVARGELFACIYLVNVTAGSQLTKDYRVELHPGDYVTVSASRYPFANVLPQGRRGEDWVHSISKTLNWNSRQKQKSFK